MDPLRRLVLTSQLLMGFQLLFTTHSLQATQLTRHKGWQYMRSASRLVVEVVVNLRTDCPVSSYRDTQKGVSRI
jgi:hypothetical protein